MDIVQDLKRHLQQETQLHKELNSYRSSPDLDDRYEMHFEYARQRFAEHSNLMAFDNGTLSFHDRMLEVVSERRQGKGFDTLLRGFAAHYADQGRQGDDVLVEIRLHTHTPLRSLNRREIFSFFLLPNQGALGAIVFEDNRHRILVARVENVHMLAGQAQILAAHQAKKLQEATVEPATPTRPRRRM